MKKLIFNISGIVAALTTAVFMLTSCEQREFADAAYPEQVIYMPAANYNNFMIDVVPEKRGSSPTPGYPERFKVDNQNGKFNVLLGVYRAGIYPDGSLNVDIMVNTDTISKLLAVTGALPAGTTLLPPDKYSLVSSVEIKDGERLAKFDLEVDLNFLMSNYPDVKYALGVGISTTERKINPDLALAIIVIDTKIMKPDAGFTFLASGGDPKTINFTNTSVNGVNYIWDFGDGSASSDTKSPAHTYSAAGNYNVTLTTIGITGQPEQAAFSTLVNIL